MTRADVLCILHRHRAGNQSAPISALCHKSPIPEHIHHEDLKRTSREDRTKAQLSGRISEAESGDTGTHEVEGWTGRIVGMREGFADLPALEERAWPAVGDEEGNRVRS